MQNKQLNALNLFPFRQRKDWDEMFRNKEMCEQSLGCKLKLRDPFDEAYVKAGFHDCYEYMFENM